MIYELIRLSNDYSASYTPFMSMRLQDLLLDYERGYDVDKDELIALLVEEYTVSAENLVDELEESYAK